MVAPHRNHAGTVWVVAGPPGAGKSTAASILAERLDPPGALLDKDTVFDPFVTATLSAAGRPDGLREGPWYDEHVKAYEYAGLAAAVREIRRSGCPVIVVAPYTQQIYDLDRWCDLVTAFGGAPVRLIWLDIDPATLRQRLVARGSHRDTAKLADFAAFLARMRPGTPPVVPHDPIDATLDRAALIERIDALAHRNTAPEH